MFPAVAQARRRNIRTPERRVSDMQRRSPSDGILPHSLSPRKSPSAELSSDAVTVGSSWMLRRASGAESSDHPRACAPPQGSVSLPRAVTNGGLSPSRHGQGHYGFNATAHTNDRAVALAYRIQSHPFLRKDKQARSSPAPPPAPLSTLSPPPLRRVHVQGQFGHSVELHQSIVANRGDIVQKYSSVTKQRGFQDAEAMQQHHAEQLQRRLDLPFPNPVPPAPARLLSVADAARKTTLQGIQYAALYETFPSHDSTGQFFLDSALPCAAVRGDACPSSSVLDEADSSHLELVRELVKAAAASLNATSHSAVVCGPACVLYCTADVRQPARMNPSHMDTVLIPALSSLLRLPALSFVDLCRHGCGAARSLAERMAAADSSVSLVVVDVNVALGDGAAPSDSSAEDSGVFGDLDALVGSCCSAIARGCKLRIVFLLPKAASSALFLEKLPSVSRAAAGHVTTCQLQTDLVLSWDELDDCVVSASLPLLFSMMCILRSIHYNPDDQQSPHTSWWQQWDAEEAILKAISPSLLTATSMLKSRPCNSSTRPVSRVATASSRISSRSSLLSRGSTSSIVAKSGATLGEPPALACTFPAIICTFADEANAEEVLQWFTSGACRLLAEQDSQSAVDSNPNQSTNAGAFSPIFASAARFGTARTTMVAENVCEELISSLARQLHGQRAHDVASEVGPSGCRDLEELQLKLAALILCDESEQRGVILLLPCSSPAILDCFHASLNAVPSHVVIMLLTPVHTAQHVQSWLHPTIQTSIDDVGAAQVHISVATAAGSRMPACINGGECSTAAAADAESAAADQPSVSVSWNQIYDTRCAMMMHRDFAKHALTKLNSSAKLPQLQHRVSSPYSPSGSPRPRVSSPYSPTGSPRLSSPSHEIDGVSGGRRSPLSASLMRRSPAAALGRQPMCCQALSVACQVFSSQAVGAVIGAVLACPGLPLHLISAAASAVARLMARDAATMSPNALPSHRELRTAAVCLAPFFFDTRVAKTELSLSVKFPNLLHNFEAQFGVSPAKWEELQQAACSSLLLVADPAADGTFVGLAAAGTWLCENLLLMLLDSNCHDTACEVANNVMKWHAVQQCLGLSKAQAVVQRCSAAVHYLALHAGADTLKFRVLRNAHDDLRAILEVLQLNLRDSQHVGVLEGFVLWLWLSAKPDVTKVGLITAALRRIAALQDRVLTIFKNSAGILKCSAPGCVWRLLQRANAAEWLSHKQLLGAVVSGNSDVDGLLLQVRKKAVLLQACAFVRQPATPAAQTSPPRLDAAPPEVSNND